MAPVARGERLLEFRDQAAEILAEIDLLHVRRRVEAAMDLHDRNQAELGVRERMTRRVVRHRAHLQANQRPDEREAVGDPVVHLAQQNRLAFDQRLEPAIRRRDLFVSGVLLTPEMHLPDRLFNRGPQQVQEIAGDGLDDVVGRPCLQRGDGNLAFL